MINFYSNMSFDEMMKEISYENFDLFIELESRIKTKIQGIYTDIESAKDQEDDYNLHAVYAMEYLCGDVKWNKDETKTGIRYSIQGLDENTHYDNHNISIYALKARRDEWLIQIACGKLGETGKQFKINGNFKEAQKRAIIEAKNQLLNGNHFIIND